MGFTTRRDSGAALAVAVAVFAACLAYPAPALSQDDNQLELTSQKRVADLVRDRVLDGEFGERTLWMTPQPLDQSHVARDLVAERTPDIRFPYETTWLVMIDDDPEANFAHPVRWVFVDAVTGEVGEVIERDFPPLVLSEDGQGESVEFRCVPVTARACPELAVSVPSGVLTLDTGEDCLYAVLVSGGINNGSNYDRYRQNLRSMYQILRANGYRKANIFVYYADGASLDLDNADGDNNDATGGDVTGGADESAIRAKIQDLCATLDPDEDILFTYFSNHGADDTGVCLWDGDNDGLESGELYSPSELASDTANCQVCRHFMIHDQCFAGDYLPMASDGNHANLAVYAAAAADEVSYGRQYLAQWEQNDASTTTVNAMHQDVVANGNLSSTPGMAEGTAGIGNNLLGECCSFVVDFWPWIILLVVIVIIIWWWMTRRSGANQPA